MMWWNYSSANSNRRDAIEQFSIRKRNFDAGVLCSPQIEEAELHCALITNNAAR